MSNILRTYSTFGEVRTDEKNDLTRYWNISNSDPDMHRSVVPVDKWDLEFFNRAGAFYYQHVTDGNSFWAPDPDLALGPARAMVEGKNLVGAGTFEPKEENELSGKILFKVDYGTMKMTSVGFVPTVKGKWGDEEKGQNPELYYFQGQRLLEFSCVHIASNLGAQAKSMQSMDKFLLAEIDNHSSEAYQRDFKRYVSHRHNKTILIPDTVEKIIESPRKEKKQDDRAIQVRDSLLFINQNLLQNV